MVVKNPNNPIRVIIEPMSDAGGTHTTFSDAASVNVHLVDDWQAEDEVDFQETWNYPTFAEAEKHAKALAEEIDSHIEYWVL